MADIERSFVPIRLGRRRPPAFPAAIAAGGRGAPAGGWTLVEALIAVTIAGLLTLAAVPALDDYLSRYRQLAHAQMLALHLTRARSEAIMRGGRVNLCRAAGTLQCAAAGGWESGWITYVDRNHDGDIDGDEAVLEAAPPAPPGVTVSPNRPLAAYVSYTSLGQARRLDGALQMGTFSVCRRGQTTVQVVLANTGRVRVQRTAIPCG
jgi:type IV fimbrial biogenesis protein FimT